MSLIIAGYYLLCVLFAAQRLLFFARYLQQEEYHPLRFMDWISRNRFYETKGTAASILGLAIAFFSPLLGLVISSGLLTFFLLTEQDPRKSGKLPLKMTERVCTLYTFSLILSLVVMTGGFLWLPALYPFTSLLFVLQVLPMLLIAGSLLTLPGEKRKQRRFISEAKAKLQAGAPYIIGITGSYGKTSTKEALGQILQVSLGAAYWPPKGINTILGATRHIRENFTSGYTYAIFEMGAYGLGSIKKLCGFTPPSAAIITAIGTAHLERFGSQEIIKKAKAELAEALPVHGILVCNGDDQGAREIGTEHINKTVLYYGFEPGKGSLDCWISHYKPTPTGTEFVFTWQGRSYAGVVPLFGKPAISNAAAAFTLACALGANPELAIAALANLQPVENRLCYQNSGGIAYLQDAYNSNPCGFSAALRVLKELPCKRRILITPGMIELGQLQAEANRTAALEAAGICDLAIVVGPTNREALIGGLKAGGLNDDKIIVQPDRAQAFRLLQELKQPGDLILIENDLPDIYEGISRI